MTLERLRAQSLAPGTTSVLIRGLTEGSGELAGYAFATRWQYEGRTICWVTQLCVAPEYRREGLATKVCFPRLLRWDNWADFEFLAPYAFEKWRGQCFRDSVFPSCCDLCRTSSVGWGD
jgi:GNAT superfamily N-acetyltransferase